MSRGFSYAQIGGTLGKDPESRATPGGVKVVNFSLAVEKGFGEKTRTDWHNIVAFDKNAEFAEKYLKKGKSVMVTGDLQVKSWEDKQTGQKRTATEIVAHKIDFMDSGVARTGEGSTRPAPTPRQQAAPQPRAVAEDPFITDDDIPF
jgi:single-strand DNA-binding protein